LISACGVAYRFHVIDLVLRGGAVCDGTGTPARTADVAIDGGRITEIGRVTAPARRVLDVSGLVVSPGFVDVHTHYDAQITWDPLCTPSCWHGVTTVVLGNCGFSLAPCRRGDRDRLLRMLEHVEGMPLESLRTGIHWSWESVPEYLDMLRTTGLGLNVAALAGHSALRVFVMGEAAYDRAATDGEVARMQSLVREAMAAGALGFATSRSTAHVGEGGRPVPSRRATRAELRALAAAMAAGGRGVIEITPETFPIDEDELSFLQDLTVETGRPVSFSAILDLPERDGVWEPVWSRLRAGRARGARVVPQVSCRPMRFEFDLVTGCASLDALPAWKRFREARDHAALLADPEFRAAVRAQTLGRPDAPSSRRWATVVVEETRDAAQLGFVGGTLADVAAARGGDVIDALFDLALADDLGTRFSMLLLNYDEDRVGDLLRRPDTLIALSDAGAHVSVLCDAGYATHFLGHWVRERGLLPLEEAVRRLTSVPADVYGVADRGRLVPGAAADVTCFDAARVGSRQPARVADFPAGAPRWIVRSDGIAHVLVGGVPFLESGECTGTLPGRLV
jgi:N-acyl-D-aspartate/D-glutamate deacylase